MTTALSQSTHGNITTTVSQERGNLRVAGSRFFFIARTALAAGAKNTLPLEIWAMTTNVTSPALYALGTVTTVISFVVIVAALSSIAFIQRKRSGRT